MRVERRDAPDGSATPYELWFVQSQTLNGDGVGTPEEHPLIKNVQNITFTLYYDVGPRLRRATIDLTIRPDDLKDAAIGAGLDSPSMRLVTTVAPRRTSD